MYQDANLQMLQKINRYDDPNLLLLSTKAPFYLIIYNLSNIF